MGIAWMKLIMDMFHLWDRVFFPMGIVCLASNKEEWVFERCLDLLDKKDARVQSLAMFLIALVVTSV